MRLFFSGEKRGYCSVFRKIRRFGWSLVSPFAWRLTARGEGVVGPVGRGTASSIPTPTAPRFDGSTTPDPRAGRAARRVAPAPTPSRTSARRPHRANRDRAVRVPNRAPAAPGPTPPANGHWTRATPRLGARHQPGPDRVALDVAQHQQQMVVLLDGKRLEAALPNVAAGAVVLQVAADMGGQQPMHPAAEVAVVMRPQRQVEVIGHQAVGEDAQGVTQARLGHHPQERLMVLLFMEDLGTAIAAIQHMITKAAGRSTQGSRHRC